MLASVGLDSFVQQVAVMHGALRQRCCMKPLGPVLWRSCLPLELVSLKPSYDSLWWKRFWNGEANMLLIVNVAWWVECDVAVKMHWTCMKFWIFQYLYRWKWWEPVYVTPCLQHNQELLMDVLSFASTEDATRAEAAMLFPCFANKLVQHSLSLVSNR